MVEREKVEMGDRGMRVFKEGVRGGNERKGAGLGEGFKTRAKRASEGGGILFFEIFFFSFLGL